MDKYEFMELVTEMLENLGSEEAIASKSKEMIDIVKSTADMQKMYLKGGF